MWFLTSSGRIELKMTLAQAESMSHQGRCDEDVAGGRTIPSIKRQLNKIDEETLRSELKEYGAWDEEELKDHEANLNRILWLAACEIKENNHHHNQLA